MSEWQHPARGKEGVLPPGWAEWIGEQVFSAPFGKLKVDAVELNDRRPLEERTLSPQRAILAAACRSARKLSQEKVQIIGAESLAAEGGVLVSQAAEAVRAASSHMVFALGDTSDDARRFVEAATELLVAAEALEARLAPPAKAAGRRRAEIADAVAADVMRSYERVTGQRAPKNTSPDAPARRILEAVGADLKLALGAENMRRGALRPSNN
jgi:hypothetical protein